MSTPAEIAIRVINVIENRELEKLQALYHPEIEFHWPPGFSYSGDHSGTEVATMSQAFGATWLPLQPDAETRRMEPVVIAENGNDVVVNYVWRARSPAGDRFETPVLAHYRIADDRLREARMFYYDPIGLAAFLDRAGSV